MAASTKIISNDVCRNIYKNSLPLYTTLDEIFDNLTICTRGIGDVDIYGNYVVKKDVLSRRYGHNSTTKVISVVKVLRHNSWRQAH